MVRGKGVRGKEPYRSRCAVTPRSLSDVKDTAERKTIARQMTIMAITWKESTLLADIKMRSRRRNVAPHKGQDSPVRSNLNKG